MKTWVAETEKNAVLRTARTGEGARAHIKQPGRATLESGCAIWGGMANNRAPIPDNPEDRRDIIEHGTTLSGSTKRDNDATEKGVHPQVTDQLPTPSEAVADANRSYEEVDQDPGERQKRNQGGEKEDPLAA